MSEDIKNGDMVMCRNDFCGESTGPFRFIGVTQAGFYAVEEDGVKVYLYAERVPEPTYKPFDQDTFPKGLTWIIKKGEVPLDELFMVTHIAGLGIYIDGKFNSYKKILDNKYLISTDNCETWQPAGVEE